MQNLENRWSVQKCAQKAGPYVLKVDCRVTVTSNNIRTCYTHWTNRYVGKLQLHNIWPFYTTSHAINIFLFLYFFTESFLWFSFLLCSLLFPLPFCFFPLYFLLTSRAFYFPFSFNKWWRLLSISNVNKNKTRTRSTMLTWRAEYINHTVRQHLSIVFHEALVPNIPTESNSKNTIPICYHNHIPKSFNLHCLYV